MTASLASADATCLRSPAERGRATGILSGAELNLGAGWLSLGATAISVLAGAQLLLPQSLPSLASAHSSIEGFTLFLWAFGTWWFPFPILLTVWRYRKLAELAYEQTLWSMVFPLAMYAVATHAYGRAAGLPLLPGIAAVELWLALAAWLAVAGWIVVSLCAPGWPSNVTTEG